MSPSALAAENGWEAKPLSYLLLIDLFIATLGLPDDEFTDLSARQRGARALTINNKRFLPEAPYL